MSTTKKQITKTKNKNWILKIIALIIAAILMGFAQSILNYTSSIGMAPIDSASKGVENATPTWIVYSRVNYITVTALVLVAIWVSPKEKRLITSSAFITGYTLAFLVTMLTNHVVGYLPGLDLVTEEGKHNATLDHPNIYADPTFWPWFWFLIGFGFLTLAIGIWVNVGFGIRPYDIMLIRLSERPGKRNYIWTRNISDFCLVLISILLSTIGFLFQINEGEKGYDNYFGYLAVGPGTILFVVAAGYVSNFWIKVFKKII